MSKRDARNYKVTEKNAKSNCSRCFYYLKLDEFSGHCRKFNFQTKPHMISDGFLESEFQEEEFGENTNIIREYKNTGHSSMIERFHPNAYIPKPTGEDYTKGVMKRYFCKYRSRKTNSIVEISINDYKSLNSQYYQLIEIPWRISGTKDDEYNNQGQIVSKGIANSNRDVVKLMDKEFIGLMGYLKDYTELAYVKGETIYNSDEALPAESVFGSGKSPQSGEVIQMPKPLPPPTTEEE